MPVVPTVYGLPVEHSDRVLREAEAAMHSRLERLRPGCRKAQQTLIEIGKQWAGWDGTRSMRGPRVVPTVAAVRQVAGMVRDGRPEVRLQAFAELQWALELAPLALDDILIGLDDATPFVRSAAARLLAKLGPAIPESSIPQLRSRLSDPVWSVRWLMVQVLVGRVAPAELVATMLASVPGPNSDVYHPHDWLVAANAISPMAPELAERILKVEAGELG
jgi:hypothetical protein